MIHIAPKKNEIIDIKNSGLAISIIPNNINKNDIMTSVQVDFFKNFSIKITSLLIIYLRISYYNSRFLSNLVIFFHKK